MSRQVNDSSSYRGRYSEPVLYHRPQKHHSSLWARKSWLCVLSIYLIHFWCSLGANLQPREWWERFSRIWTFSGWGHAQRTRTCRRWDGFNLVCPDVKRSLNNWNHRVLSRRSSLSGPLMVENVDMCQQVNKPNHYTTAYDTQNLVVRRGQEFVMRVTFSRPLTQEDDFQLEFLIGQFEFWLARGWLVWIRALWLVTSLRGWAWSWLPVG